MTRAIEFDDFGELRCEVHTMYAQQMEAGGRWDVLGLRLSGGSRALQERKGPLYPSPMVYLCLTPVATQPKK